MAPQEFYPTPPTTSLILTWASILDRAQIPDDMVHKSVVIPYRILFDLFAPLKSRPEPLPGARSPLIFNYNDDVPGVDMSSDSSGPESEASQPDLGVDAGYLNRGGVVPASDRVTRLGSRNSGGARIG